jgi:diguanylate cyclase (GGDEF)-like protein
VGDGVLLAMGGPLADVTAAALTGAGVRVKATPLSGVLRWCDRLPARAVVIDLGAEDPRTLAELRAGLPPDVRMIAIVPPTPAVAPEISAVDTVLHGVVDPETILAALAPDYGFDPTALATALVHMSVLGADAATVRAQVAASLAHAFAADQCILQLEGEEAFSVEEPATAQSLMTLATVASDVSGTVLVGPAADHPYRAFVGARLESASLPSIGTLLLCRKNPVRFGDEALAMLRALAGRLAIELSWRRAHDRLVQDRERLRELSRVDPGLGIWNRTTLEQELPDRVVVSQRRGEPLSVAIVDVDALRHINQRHGYPAGDAVLLHVAQMARRELRAQDIVARYAGDALALILPGADLHQAELVLERVLREIDAAPVRWEGDDLPVTVSCGVAQLIDDDDTANAALGRAVAARRDARRTGTVIALADATTRASHVQHDLETDATLGGTYQIRHEISRGAFGVVYRAEDLALGRHVALKLLRPDLARDHAVVERFRVEAATLARIRHTNLVQVYAFGIEGQNVYFAMELIEGQSLDHRIVEASRRNSYMALSESIRIIDEVAGALDAVHRGGMVHRDVKPENILIDRVHRRAVLVDAGIAVRRGEKDPAGTPGFTAPEVFGNANEGPWTDVYGLGAVAYCLLTGEAPFGRGQPQKVIELQARTRPPSLGTHRQDLPDDIDELLLPALDPDPQKRPQTVRSFASDLLTVLRAHAGTGVGTRPRRPPTPRPSTRQPSQHAAPVAPSVAAARAPANDVLSPRLATAPTITNTNPPPMETPWTLRNPLGAETSEPFTRGVLFRACYPVLGSRRGADWLRTVSREDPSLASVLGPGSSPLAWHPTSQFITLLRSISQLGVDPRLVAAQLGREAVDSSFGLFYAADTSAVSPGDVLRAADLLWGCYHSWGRLSVSASDREAEVQIANTVADPLLCAATGGLLAEIVSEAGGVDEKVSHPRCASTGAETCVFRVSWTLPPPA